MDTTWEETIARQKRQLELCLKDILVSKERKKLIVSGPGTGKTFTFTKVLKQTASNKNLTMTFIRKLVKDMEIQLDAYSEITTFHAYCKKILHQQNSQYELAPYLTTIVEKDATLLKKRLGDFNTKFQLLDDNSPEISFFLQRGDYYKAISFDDSVYRVYMQLRQSSDILPNYDQIVIDEYQDFNALEVAFIDELAKRGNILIVGDDDQAIYDDRSASPKYIRQKYESSNFTIFELPFCMRCPDVIVRATNAILERANTTGHLQGRIPKRFECYLDAKQNDSSRYPKIAAVCCSMVSVVSKYIEAEISKIDRKDIDESFMPGKEYPTVLIIGRGHYLEKVEKNLRSTFPQIILRLSEKEAFSLKDAYALLLKNRESNLGWRIIMEHVCNVEEQIQILTSTETGIQIIKLLGNELVSQHLRVVDMIRSIRNGERLSTKAEFEFRSIVDKDYDLIVQHFMPTQNQTKKQVDKTQPSILLTSFKGCKGLSAGHVFIIGANDKTIPKDPMCITDVEISQFVVALTRTRKRCHVVSNIWFDSPKNKKGEWVKKFKKSSFLSWIPPGLLDNKGCIKAAYFK